jgi:hypothetical protein
MAPACRDLRSPTTYSVEALRVAMGRSTPARAVLSLAALAAMAESWLAPSIWMLARRPDDHR